MPKPDIDRRIAHFGQACRQAGLKVTHQRMEVFRELASTDEHPDAETVYQRVRKRVTGISRDTVYRTLASMESAGLIRRAGTLGGPTRYDADLTRHHHFVCKICGLVKDFNSKVLDDLPIPREVAAFGRIEDTQVQVRGVCSSCARGRIEARRRSSVQNRLRAKATPRAIGERT